MFVYKDSAERVNPIQREVHAMLRDFGEAGVPHYRAYEAGQWAAMLQTSLAQFVSTSAQQAQDPSVLDLHRRVADLTRKVSDLGARLLERNEQDKNVSAVTDALPLLEGVAARVFHGKRVSISVTRSDDDDFDVAVRLRVPLDDVDPEARAELKGRFFEELFESLDNEALKTTHFVFSSM